MHKDIAASSRFEGRCQANVTETHRFHSREHSRPTIKRAGNERMEMINIHWNRIVMSRRCGRQRVRSDQIHHDQDNALYATEVPSDLYQPKVAKASNPVSRPKPEF